MPNSTPFNLDDHLKDHSTVRENLVNYHVFYEIKKAAVKAGTDIRIYQPEIDKDGFDMIVDDGDSLVPIQMKTIQNSSQTTDWNLRKNLLRPRPFNCESLGFEFSPQGEGIEGGFLLIDMAVNECDILGYEYYYTDAYTLRAIELEIIRFRQPASRDKSKEFVNELKQGHFSEQIEITKSSVVKLSSLRSMLVLADFASVEGANWRSGMKLLSENPESEELRTEWSNFLNTVLSDESRITLPFKSPE